MPPKKSVSKTSIKKGPRPPAPKAKSMKTGSSSSSSSSSSAAGAHKVFSMPFATIYPLYVQKLQKKGRTTQELDAAVCWLTGYTKKGLQLELKSDCDMRAFF